MNQKRDFSYQKTVAVAASIVLLAVVFLGESLGPRPERRTQRRIYPVMSDNRPQTKPSVEVEP